MTEADGKGSAGLSFGQFFSYMTCVFCLILSLQQSR